MTNPEWNLRLRKYEIIIDCLKAHHWNRTHTAKALGIGIRTLQRHIAKYGLTDCYSDELYEIVVNKQAQAYTGATHYA